MRIESNWIVHHRPRNKKEGKKLTEREQLNYTHTHTHTLHWTLLLFFLFFFFWFFIIKKGGKIIFDLIWKKKKFISLLILLNTRKKKKRVHHDSKFVCGKCQIYFLSSTWTTLFFSLFCFRNVEGCVCVVVKMCAMVGFSI